MSQFSVNFPALSAFIEDAEAQCRQIRNDLAQMDESISKILGGENWVAQAREEYDSAKGRWNAAASQLPAMLDNAQKMLTQVGVNYGQIDNKGCTLWQGR